MNANELADELLNNVEAEYFESGGDIWADITDESWKIIQDAATMLRQLQAEKEIRDRYIEGMKSHISEIQAENGKLKMTLLAVTQGIQIPSMQGPMPKGVTE